MANLPDNIQSKIDEAILAGRKILAIKHHREATGANLLESKKFVEMRTAHLLDEFPDEFERVHRKDGVGDIDQVLDAIFHGQKLEAVKLYKESTGVGLREAKEFVEELTERLKLESPHQFVEPSGAGCASVLVYALITTIALGCVSLF